MYSTKLTLFDETKFCHVMIADPPPPAPPAPTNAARLRTLAQMAGASAITAQQEADMRAFVGAKNPQQIETRTRRVCTCREKIGRGKKHQLTCLKGRVIAIARQIVKNA